MATSLEGNNLDSAGNVAVDFVWGPFPLQPNDARTAGTPSATVTVGGSQNVGWTNTSTVASALLNYAYDSHAIAEANWSGHPSFIAADPVVRVTAISGNGTTVSFTAQLGGINPASLIGTNVTVTGSTVSAFNLTNATIASATALGFTVTSAAGSGVSVTGQTATATLGAGASDSDGSYIGTTGYVNVSSVIGQTTANATSILTALELVPTTGSAVTNTAKTVTAASRTAGSAVTTITASGHGFVTGDKVVLTSVDASVNGTYTATYISATQFSVSTTATTVLALTGLSGSVSGVSGTVHTQSIAAGTASVAAGAAITIASWA